MVSDDLFSIKVLDPDESEQMHLSLFKEIHIHREQSVHIQVGSTSGKSFLDELLQFDFHPALEDGSPALFPSLVWVPTLREYSKNALRVLKKYPEGFLFPYLAAKTVYELHDRLCTDFYQTPYEVPLPQYAALMQVHLQLLETIVSLSASTLESLALKNSDGRLFTPDNVSRSYHLLGLAYLDHAAIMGTLEQEPGLSVRKTYGQMESLDHAIRSFQQALRGPFHSLEDAYHVLEDLHTSYSAHDDPDVRSRGFDATSCVYGALARLGMIVLPDFDHSTSLH